MEDLTFGEQVKIILGRKGMTIKQLAELIEEKTGKKMSRQNLTQRLGRDNFQEQDMRMIASILECPFRLSIMTVDAQPQRSTAALERAAAARTEAVERRADMELEQESAELRMETEPEREIVELRPETEPEQETVELRADIESGQEAEPTGSAKITKAYNLPCRYVLHTVGPIIYGSVTETDRKLLADCYRSCLELASAYGLRSVAFCCISTGEFHFPNRLAAEIAIKTVGEWQKENPGQMEVIFNVFKDNDYKIYQQLL